MDNNIFNNIYLGEEYSYLRPYISKRNPYDSKVFLVGINPATPITPIQLNIDEYIGLLKNYEEFMEFYSKSRESQNKSKISRTRMGINSLVNWIEQEFNTGVIETDIFTYPTKNIKELNNIDKNILNKSIEKFWQVLLEFQPDIVILYGSLALNEFKKLVISKNKEIKYYSEEEKIEYIEEKSPYAKLNIGIKNVNIIACRHLMYYGNNGNSFKKLRENIKMIIEEQEHVLKYWTSIFKN